MFTQQEHVILLTINLSLLKTFHWLHSSALRIHFKFRPWYFFWLTENSESASADSFRAAALKNWKFCGFFAPTIFLPDLLSHFLYHQLYSIYTPGCLSLDSVRHVGKCSLYFLRKSTLQHCCQVSETCSGETTWSNREKLCICIKHDIFCVCLKHEDLSLNYQKMHQNINFFSEYAMMHGFHFFFSAD